MSKSTRREFLGYSLAAAAGVVLLPYQGCGPRATTRKGVLDIPERGYPFIEVKGSHREIGRQIGSAMKKHIVSHLALSEQYSNSVDFLEGEGRDIVKKMLDHAWVNFPRLVEELEGMAESLDVPFMSLFAFNCKSEIDLLKEPPGCSTIALRDHKHDRVTLVHNEDGNDLNIGRMFVVRVTPPSGVRFIVFVYPGLLPGNGPGINKHGIVQTTNYIQPRQVIDGIPRYFIGRAILEAKNLDEAVALATMKPRAFSYHHNLVSLLENRRILSVETAAYPHHKHDVLDVHGLYVHTNHFLHDGMVEEDETKTRLYDVPYESSITRMNVLSRAIATKGPPSNVEEIMKLLTLHEGRPYSPCRHPEGDVYGATLGTAVFDMPSRHAVTLYHGNPCHGFKQGWYGL
jgi:predicted choloylglycine hydrolase